MSLFNKSKKMSTDIFMTRVEEYTPVMYKTAYSILHNDADVADAVQETILNGYEKLDTLREPKYFKTWITKILINNCYSILRTRDKTVLDTDGIPEPVFMEDYDSDLGFKELISVVDEKYQVLLTLFYSSGFKIPEIAQMMDMNVNTVKTQLARAREQLRRYLYEN